MIWQEKLFDPSFKFSATKTRDFCPRTGVTSRKTRAELKTFPPQVHCFQFVWGFTRRPSIGWSRSRLSDLFSILFLPNHFYEFPLCHLLATGRNRLEILWNRCRKILTVGDHKRIRINFRSFEKTESNFSDPLFSDSIDLSYALFNVDLIRQLSLYQHFLSQRLNWQRIYVNLNKSIVRSGINDNR